VTTYKGRNLGLGVFGLAKALCLLIALGSASTVFAHNPNFSATPNPNQAHYTLSWDSPSGRWWIEERFNGGSWVSLGLQPAEPMDFENKPIGTYDYRIKYEVRTCSGGGGRGDCDVDIFYTSTYAVTVERPEIVSQVISLDGTFDIGWPAVTGASTYTLQERPSGGSWTQVYSGSLTSQSLTKTNGDYEYRVKACAPADGCSYSLETDMSVEIVSHLQTEPGIASTTSAGKTSFDMSVDAKGNATVILPISVPNGVNDMAPGVSLSYSSGASPALFEDKKTEGVLGYGWSVSGIPVIRRCRVGLDNQAIQYDSTDRLCLNGTALVKVSGSSYWADNAEYRTEIQSFSKIEAQGTGLANRHFEVSGPDGTVTLFGSTDEARLHAPGETDPYLWSVKSQTDAFNNAISYTWHELDSVGTNYLRFIDYGNYQVAFEYEERCQSLTLCDIDEVQAEEVVPGINVQAVALNEIKTKVNGTLVSSYRLDNNYVNGYLRLEKVQHCGYNESGSSYKCLAPTQFGWDTLTIEDTAEPESADLLVVDTVTDGFGDQGTFDYAIIDGSGSCCHALHVHRPSEFPANALPSNVGTSTRQRALVQFLNMPDGDGGTTKAEFKYHEYPLYDDDGRGFVGFPITYVELHDQPQFDASTGTNFDAHVRSYTQYRLDFPFIGNAGRNFSDVQTDASNSSIWTRVEKRLWKYKNKTSFSSTVHFPHLDYQLMQKRELRADGSLGYASAQKVDTSYCWRTLSGNTCPGSGTNFEYPSQITTTTESGSHLTGTDDDWGIYGHVSTGLSLSGTTKTGQRVVNLENISASWLLSFVARIESGWGTTSITETDEIEISRASTSHNKPGIINHFPGDAAYDRDIVLGYDTYDNLTSVNDTGVNQTPALTTFSTFLDNRYPQSTTNAESLTSSLGYDSRFGTVDSVTDPNSDISTTSRDEFGRVTETQGPDGTTVTITYASCSSGCTAVTWATPRLKITRATDNNSTQVAPDEVTYVDTRGLPVLTEIEAFSSSDGWIRVQRHYDRAGRLVKQSLPYFSSGGTAKFVETFYDYQGRQIHVS